MHPSVRFFQKHRISLQLLVLASIAFRAKQELWQSLGLTIQIIGMLSILPLAYLVMKRFAAVRSQKKTAASP